MNKPEIIVYARERYCPDVTRTRDRLTALRLPWTEYDIEADPNAAATVEELTGMRRVPTVLIGENVLIEPQDDELDSTLRSVGYDIDSSSATAVMSINREIGE